MSSRTWITAALVVAAGAVGVPRLVRQATAQRPSAPVDRPADDESSGDGGGELVFADSFGASPAPRPTVVAPPQPPQTSVVPEGAPPPTNSTGATGATAADPLAASLARLEAFLPRWGASSLDLLARGESPVTTRGAAVETPAARGQLERYLAEAPLRGLLISDGERAALLGDRLVRPGDTLLGGVARVVAVDAGGLTLEVEGRALRVELPPLRARRAAASSSAGSEPEELR